MKAWASPIPAPSNRPDSNSGAGSTWRSTNAYLRRRPRRWMVRSNFTGGYLRFIALLAVIAAAPAHAQIAVAFDRFQYTGRDSTYDIPSSNPRDFRNPILGGYYPDPSITRVGDTYYLVNSTFAHWPGIPIHASRDLVNWRLVGHALNDANRFSFDGLGISRGVFAPSIHHHKGIFYVINTLVDA